MGSIWFCASILLSFTLIICNVASLEIGIGGGGIIIGGGGGSPPSEPPSECPPPPPTPCPPPPPPGLNPRLRRDRATILRLKKKIMVNPAVNDPLGITKTWTATGNPCKFKGFNCSMNPIYKIPTLSDVQFNGFKLGGATLTDFIDKLVDVSIFHANSNNFTGTVPSITAGNIPFLFELDLSNNKLTGEFPTQVLKATNLTFLDLRFNSFEMATVPPSVFKLDVDVLFINNNNFPPQELPLELGFTPALYLTVANNKFTGPIPYTIGQARKTLLEVLFLSNELSGCLPWQIGLLKLARVFDASGNYIHGPIPSSFACLENLQILNLRNNQLDGVVPENLCALPKLTNLTLSNNYFTEVGPKCRELIQRKVLDISNNCITGLYEQRQRPPWDCDRFFSGHPREACPYQYLHAPCPAAAYGNHAGGSHPPSLPHHRRLAAQDGPLVSVTYGALNP